MAEYPEVLTDAAACLAQALERQGIGPERASDLAFEAVEALRARWGGMDLYIPKAQYLETAPKHERIWELYRAGCDLRAIAQETGYSVQRVRQVIRQARAARALPVHAPSLLETD